MPAVLEFIPYRQRDLTSVRDSMHHPYLAGHGFAGVRVDLRGSGDSEGVLTDEYLERELRDAEEVLAWLAAQPTTCPGPRSDSATLRATVMSGVVKLLPGALMVTGLSELAAGAMVAGSSRRRCWPAFSPACPAAALTRAGDRGATLRAALVSRFGCGVSHPRSGGSRT